MRKISLSIALAGLIAAGSAAAASSPATGSFNVTANVQGSCKVTATTRTTYGRIPAGQDVGLGSFSDTVTVEVAF
jgi:spore coat protein U-like protein